MWNLARLFTALEKLAIRKLKQLTFPSQSGMMGHHQKMEGSTMARDRVFTIEYFIKEGDGMTVKRGFLKTEVASFIRSNDLVERAEYIRIFADDATGVYSYNQSTRQIERDTE